MFEKIGITNQTTMLASESIDIAKKVKETMLKKYGSETINDYFRAFDNICSATQNRQEVIVEILKTSPDTTLVIGGFKSSDPISLNHIASKYGLSFHITDAGCLFSTENIHHKPDVDRKAVKTKNRLTDTEIPIAVTVGTSTQNNVISDVIKRITLLASLE